QRPVELHDVDHAHRRRRHDAAESRALALQWPVGPVSRGLLAGLRGLPRWPAGAVSDRAWGTVREDYSAGGDACTAPLQRRRRELLSSTRSTGADDFADPPGRPAAES